jgi:hypothetical protein
LRKLRNISISSPESIFFKSIFSPRRGYIHAFCIGEKYTL